MPAILVGFKAPLIPGADKHGLCHVAEEDCADRQALVGSKALEVAREPIGQMGSALQHIHPPVVVERLAWALLKSTKSSDLSSFIFPHTTTVHGPVLNLF